MNRRAIRCWTGHYPRCNAIDCDEIRSDPDKRLCVQCEREGRE